VCNPTNLAFGGPEMGTIHVVNLGLAHVTAIELDERGRLPTARVIRPKGYVAPAASVGRMPSDDCPGRGSDEVAVGSATGAGRSRTFDAFPG